jgi:hypothetical protein
MKSKDVYPKYKLWSAPVRITQADYVGTITVTVTAESMNQARQLMKQQYGVKDWHIGSIREIK